VRPILLFLFCFWHRFSLTLPSWSQTCDPPDSTSQGAGIIGMHYHT
jgi:hypothetical protein